MLPKLLPWKIKLSLQGGSTWLLLNHKTNKEFLAPRADLMADPMTALMTDRIADQNCDVGPVLQSCSILFFSLTISCFLSIVFYGFVQLKERKPDKAFYSFAQKQLCQPLITRSKMFPIIMMMILKIMVMVWPSLLCKCILYHTIWMRALQIQSRVYISLKTRLLILSPSKHPKQVFLASK